MSKQTAVEWLLSQIPLGIRMNLAENGIDFDKALAMEKEQIVDACNLQRSDYRGMPTYNKSGEQYYNETYASSPKTSDNCPK